MNLGQIFGTKVADVGAKRADTVIADQAGKAVEQAVTGGAINTVDKAAFGAAAGAAAALSPKDIAKQLMDAKPTWTNDNRDMFKTYLDNLLGGIKNIRGMVEAPKAALGSAKAQLAADQAKFIVPVNQAQGVVSAVDGKFRPVAEQADCRLGAAKQNLRTTMRPGADTAISRLNTGAASVRDVRNQLNTVAMSDVEAPLATIEGANNTIYQAANRVQQGGTALAGDANSLVYNTEAGVSDIGNQMVATGNGIAGDAAATAQNTSGFAQGIANIRSAHATVRGAVQNVDANLAATESNLEFAAQALAANPADETVLAHARTIATSGDTASYTAGRDALMSDFAGQNPGAVFPALDNATTGVSNAKVGIQSINPGAVLDADLRTMDQTAGVIGQTGTTMQAGADSVRPTLQSIVTQDPALQEVLDRMGTTGDGLGADTNMIASQASLLDTNPVRAINDDINLATNSVATSSSQLETLINQAKLDLSATPTDAQIQGSAKELVSSFDARTSAWKDLADNLAGPQQALQTESTKYAANIKPSSDLVDAATAALHEVTVPLGQLEEFTRGLPDTVGTMTRLHWNNPVAFFDKGKVDVGAVYAAETQQILGSKL